MQLFKKSLGFLAAVLVLAFIAQYLLQPVSGFAMKMEEFTEKEYTGVILGNSWSRDGLNPQLLSGEEERIFNISAGDLRMGQMKFILKEMQKTSTIDKVYLDLCPYYWKEGEEKYHPNIGGSLSGWNRIQYLLDQERGRNVSELFFNCEFDGDTIWALYDFVITKFHWPTRQQLLEQFASDKEGDYLGDGFSYVNQTEQDLYPVDYFSLSPQELSGVILKDFQDLLRYCEGQNIAVIAVHSALPPARLESEPWNVSHDLFTEICRQENIPFYDMNYVKWELLPRTAEDYSDLDGHMMGELANRQTELLKTILESEDPKAFFAESYEEVLSGIANARHA